MSMYRYGHASVVKASITGSIIGNLLLVLGFAMAAGGIRPKWRCNWIRLCITKCSYSCIRYTIECVFYMSCLSGMSCKCDAHPVHLRMMLHKIRIPAGPAKNTCVEGH